MDKLLQLAIAGASGRMGAAVARAAAARRDIAAPLMFDREPGPGLTTRTNALARAEVVIDFTTGAASAELAALAAKRGGPALVIGSTGLTAALYTLAGNGTIKIIAANGRDAPGFPQYGFIISNKAYENGLKSYKDLTGKSVALGEIGAPAHYALSLVTAKFGVDMKTIRILPMQAIVNVISAVTGGQADGGLTPASAVTAAVQKGDVRLLGYTGDEVPSQGGATVITAKNANENGDMVRRYLKAVKRGARDYYDAFVGPDMKPHHNPTADAVLAIITKYTGQPGDQIEKALPFMDPEMRLDEKDVLRQIDWYKSQGMLKPNVDGSIMIDNRYAVPLPG